MVCFPLAQGCREAAMPAGIPRASSAPCPTQDLPAGRQTCCFTRLGLVFPVSPPRDFPWVWWLRSRCCSGSCHTDTWQWLCQSFSRVCAGAAAPPRSLRDDGSVSERWKEARHPSLGTEHSALHSLVHNQAGTELLPSALALPKESLA